MKNLLVASLISSIIAIILLGYTIMQKNQKETKESLCLCDNLGNSVYKPYNTDPAIYAYQSTPFGF